MVDAAHYFVDEMVKDVVAPMVSGGGGGVPSA